MSFNEKLPEWNDPGIEPPQSKKDEGFYPGEKPPAQWFNWLLNRIYKAIQEIREKVVIKVVGKDLSTNDYTTEEKIKLGGVSKQATKVESSAINGNIKIDGVQAKVYEHPASHPAAMIEESTTKKFVSDTEKNNWNGKETTTGAQAKANDALVAANTYTDQEIDEVSAIIGNTTIDDTLIPNSDTGLSVKILLSWLANMIKSITGKANWRTKPTKNLEELNTAINEHKAELATQDELGHIKLSDIPSTADDIGAFDQSNYGNILSSTVALTLDLSHTNTVLVYGTTSARTITVPNNTSVPFPIGTQITVVRDSTGTVTFTPASGVTLNSKDTKRGIDGRYASATLIKTDTNRWDLIGALV